MLARHAVEEKLVDPKKMIQIGIRGPLAGGDDLRFCEEAQNLKTVDEILLRSLLKFCQSLPSFGDTPTYISFDVDCLDPCLRAGNGNASGWGFNDYETQQILRHLKI